MVENTIPKTETAEIIPTGPYNEAKAIHPVHTSVGLDARSILQNSLKDIFLKIPQKNTFLIHRIRSDAKPIWSSQKYPAENGSNSRDTFNISITPTVHNIPESIEKEIPLKKYTLSKWLKSTFDNDTTIPPKVASTIESIIYIFNDSKKIKKPNNIDTTIEEIETNVLLIHTGKDLLPIYLNHTAQAQKNHEGIKYFSNSIIQAIFSKFVKNKSGNIVIARLSPLYVATERASQLRAYFAVNAHCREKENVDTIVRNQNKIPMSLTIIR